MVELNQAFGRWNIAARMVDVVTAEIYLSQGETDITGELDKADFSGAAKVIFDQIHGKSSGGAGSVTTVQPSVGSGTETFTDSRDGKTYKTMMIGRKTWMAENLNHQPQYGNSWCYGNNNSNCNKYGRLYDWNTAKAICPAGFHLPSRQDWDNLVSTVGGKEAVGKKLKARSGWKNNGNGTNDFGFSALPGGYYYGGGFDLVGEYGYWWTSTENGGNNAYYRRMNYYYGNMFEYNDNKSSGLSVRCVADSP